MTSFGEAITLFYKNYVNFQGRASRAEYWWPTLMQVVIYTGLIIGFVSLVGSENYEASGDINNSAMIILITGVLFALVNFLPGLSLKVRRFHDLDQTGWLVPVFWGANLFFPLVEFGRMLWFAFPGTDGPNQYGSDPYWNDAEVFG